MINMPLLQHKFIFRLNKKDHNSLLTSRGHSNSYTIVEPDEGYSRNKLVRLTSSPLQKDPICLIDRTEPHGSKPCYKVSYNSYNDRLYGEEHFNFIRTCMNLLTKTKKILNIQKK